MQEIVKKIILLIIDLYLKTVTKITNGRVLLLTANQSGSNTYALYKNCPDNIDAHLLRTEELRFKYALESGFSLESFVNKRKLLYSSQIVVTTHGGPIFRKPKTVRLDVWHGVPLKAIGFMDKAVEHTYSNKSFRHITRLFSCSEFQNTLMSSAYHQKSSYFKVTGLPRNDYLFENKAVSISKLSLLFPAIETENRSILYLPTYRVDAQVEYNLLKLVELDEFNLWLRNNKLNFIFKSHPGDRTDAVNKTDEYSNVFVFDDEALSRFDFDLYELINSIGLLITDYSSIYIDLLLTDIPVLFFIPDLLEYNEKTGFLCSPFEEWTSGSVVTDHAEIYREIINSLDNPHLFKEKRLMLKHIFHKFDDANSSKRAWSEIQHYIK